LRRINRLIQVILAGIPVDNRQLLANAVVHSIAVGLAVEVMIEEWLQLPAVNSQDRLNNPRLALRGGVGCHLNSSQIDRDMK